MERNGHRPDLDLGQLMPETVRIATKTKVYEISNDLRPSLVARIHKWNGEYLAACAGEGQVDDAELFPLIAEAMGCPLDEAISLGYGNCMRVAAFLLKPWNERVSQMTSTAAQPAQPSLAESQ